MTFALFVWFGMPLLLWLLSVDMLLVLLFLLIMLLFLVVSVLVLHMPLLVLLCRLVLRCGRSSSSWYCRFVVVRYTCAITNDDVVDIFVSYVLFIPWISLLLVLPLYVIVLPL